jgi:hypothetical protein
MGTKNNPAPNDCYANALPDEPMFTLLARDPDGPSVVRYWAGLRARRIDQGSAPVSDDAVVSEALRCADAMASWRIDNDGAWRKIVPASPRSLDVRSV